MNFDEYRSYDALGLAALIRSGAVTPLEVLEVALAATDALNPSLNAVVARLDDAAREAVGQGLPSGPFTGVPFAVKDLWTDVQGVTTFNGSRLFAGSSAAHDSELVARYRRAGLVLAGKTNTPELGLSPSTEPALWGPVHHPWRQGISAGGSSGGAAAAVAAGIFPMAHATDGGGSIRIPAAYCGLFGLKPTRGRVSFAPDRGESWNGMGVAHVVSRSVRDSAAALDATAGYVPGDPYAAPASSGTFLEHAGTDPGRLRIGIITTSPTGTPTDPALVAAARRTAERCERLGHPLREVQWPFDGELLGPMSGAITSTSVAVAVDSRLRALGRTHGGGDLEPVTADIAEAGRRIPATSYASAIQWMHAVGRAMAQLFTDIDVLITPTVGRVAAPHGLLDGSDLERFRAEVGPVTAFTSLANVTGQPAMSLPLDVGADGLPIGTQMIGRFGEEATLLQVAGQLERQQLFIPAGPPGYPAPRQDWSPDTRQDPSPWR